MVTKLTIISLLVLAMISTKIETEDLKAHSESQLKVRAIHKFERDTHQSFEYHGPGSIPMEKNYYYENVPSNTTEL